MQTKNIHQTYEKTYITNLYALNFQITKNDLRHIQLGIIFHTPNIPNHVCT
jgi:hypothetical protein